MASLLVQPQCGRLTRDTATGSMSPYVIVTVGTKQERSQVHPSGGKFPQWSDNLKFPLTTEDIIKFEVWDRNHISSNDMVGEGFISIQKVKDGGKICEWIEIKHKGKAAGHIQAQMEYTPDPAAQNSNAPAAAPQQAPQAPMPPVPAQQPYAPPPQPGYTQMPMQQMQWGGPPSAPAPVMQYAQSLNAYQKSQMVAPGFGPPSAAPATHAMGVPIPQAGQVPQMYPPLPGHTSYGGPPAPVYGGPPGQVPYGGPPGHATYAPPMNVPGQVAPSAPPSHQKPVAYNTNPVQPTGNYPNQFWNQPPPPGK